MIVIELIKVCPFLQLADSEVPLFRTYCKKIDNRQYRQEAKDHTNNALMMLYAQVMDMPDGSVKTEFIEKVCFAEMLYLFYSTSLTNQMAGIYSIGTFVLNGLPNTIFFLSS